MLRVLLCSLLTASCVLLPVLRGHRQLQHRGRRLHGLGAEDVEQEGLEAAGVGDGADCRDGARIVHQRLEAVLHPLADIVLLRRWVTSGQATG